MARNKQDAFPSNIVATYFSDVLGRLSEHGGYFTIDFDLDTRYWTCSLTWGVDSPARAKVAYASGSFTGEALYKLIQDVELVSKTSVSKDNDSSEQEFQMYADEQEN